MNKRQLLDYLERIEEGNSVEIRKITDNEYQISKGVFPSIGNDENNKPQFSQGKYRSTSLVSISTVGFKSFRGMDKKPKINNDIESQVVIGIFLSLLDMFPVKNSKITTNYLTYDVKEVKGYKGFYNKSGVLRWVENNGIEYQA